MPARNVGEESNGEGLAKGVHAKVGREAGQAGERGEQNWVCSFERVMELGSHARESILWGMSKTTPKCARDTTSSPTGGLGARSEPSRFVGPTISVMLFGAAANLAPDFTGGKAGRVNIRVSRIAL